MPSVQYSLDLIQRRFRATSAIGKPLSFTSLTGLLVYAL